MCCLNLIHCSSWRLLTTMWNRSRQPWIRMTHIEEDAIDARKILSHIGHCFFRILISVQPFVPSEASLPPIRLDKPFAVQTPIYTLSRTEYLIAQAWILLLPLVYLRWWMFEFETPVCWMSVYGITSHGAWNHLSRSWCRRNNAHAKHR